MKYPYFFVTVAFILSIVCCKTQKSTTNESISQVDKHEVPLNKRDSRHSHGNDKEHKHGHHHGHGAEEDDNGANDDDNHAEAGHHHGKRKKHKEGKKDGKEHGHSGHHGAKRMGIQTTHYPEEVHLKNVRQLTFGGDNAEAYWSFDDKKLVFQAKNEKWGSLCDQIYVMDPYSDEIGPDYQPPLLSTGKGRTTCSYFMAGNKTIVYASTHEAGDPCPPEPKRRADGKYVWPIYESFDIYTADLNGNLVTKLTDEPGYDAEATLSPDGSLIVFTSIRTGDMELFTMKPDGSDVKQVTFGLGYDGGAFFSPDGTKLIFRASRPTSDEDVKIYKDLLNEGLVQPTEMELYVCNVDGSDLKKITDLGNANWAPFFHPSGKKVIFASNHNSTRGFPFNLFMINVDGTGLEQITFDKTFDSFPMFSYDGTKLVFSSNRNNGGTRDTNLFIADWVE